MIRVVAASHSEARRLAFAASPKTIQFYTRFVMYHPTIAHKRIFVFNTSG